MPTTAPAKPEVDEYGDPILSDQWIVTDCDYANLRKYADSSYQVLAKVPRGEKVTVKGWNCKYAWVEYQGIKGYIMACYLKPDEGAYINSVLDTVPMTDKLTYDQMMDALVSFDLNHPELVDLEIIGYSSLGRQIPVIRIGDINAKHHVLLHGAIHGREYATTWVLMTMIDYWLDRDLMSFGDVCYHIIPMVNPDGVTISQTKTIPDSLLSVYQYDLENGYTTLSKSEYAKYWKANGLGIDLNRNFPAGWDKVADRSQPSSRNFKGTEPFDAVETQMLRDYTFRYEFDATVSYHAMGCVIYYDYGDNKTVNAQSKSLAQSVNKVTGYLMIASNGNSHAGYKDWAIDTMQIPSLTIEIGCEDTPLAAKEMYSLFIRNRDVLPAIAKWLKK